MRYRRQMGAAGSTSMTRTTTRKQLGITATFPASTKQSSAKRDTKAQFIRPKEMCHEMRQNDRKLREVGPVRRPPARARALPPPPRLPPAPPSQPQRTAPHPDRLLNPREPSRPRSVARTAARKKVSIAPQLYRPYQRMTAPPIASANHVTHAVSKHTGPP